MKIARKVFPLSIGAGDFMLCHFQEYLHYDPLTCVTTMLSPTSKSPLNQVFLHDSHMEEVASTLRLAFP